MSEYFRLMKGAAITTICAAAFIVSVAKARGCNCNCYSPSPRPDASVIYYWKNEPDPHRKYLPPRPESDGLEDRIILGTVVPPEP